MVIEAQGLAKKRETEGYTYHQERGFDIAEEAAKNEGSGAGFTGMGIGLGMMAGVGNTIGGIVNQSVSNAFSEADGRNQTSAFCEQCGISLETGASFCQNCGAPVVKEGKCPGCGYVFTRLGKYCPHCGRKRE